MKRVETALQDVFFLEPVVHQDSRGFLLERHRQDWFLSSGSTDTLVQENHSRSGRGTLRGLHFQRKHPQGKLVGVVRGSIFDVAVDLRSDSPTFGRWEGMELNDENHRQLWVPPGFAHGFLVLSEIADVIYKCTEYYTPDDEGGILWSDPELSIRWPASVDILSDQDRSLPCLCDLHAEDLPGTVAETKL